MLKAALAYAGQQIPVFPCQPNKRPYIAGGFHSATTDPDTIRAWWAQYPDALIGIPTGEPSGIACIDLDRKNGIDGWESWLELQDRHEQAPDTLTAITPNNGYHLLFKAPPDIKIPSSAGKLGRGIDVRGDGGYIIAVGSPGYEWEASTVMVMAMWPPWLTPLTAGAPPPPDLAPAPEHSAPAERLNIRQAVVNILAGTPLHDSLRGMAAHLKSTGVADAPAIALLEALMDQSAARQIRPAEWAERRADIPRLVWSATKFETEAEERINRVPDRAELKPSLSEMTLASLAPRCIVENLLYADVAQVVAPGGTGKTTIILYEAICVALGRRLWGQAVVTPGWSLIITAEDERERLLARLREICTGMTLTDAERQTVRESVIIWDVSGAQMKLVFVRDGNLMLTTLADDIVERYRDDPPQVVLFDPLVSFGASEERVNDNEQAIITAARRILRGLGCCVRLVHHTGKGNARDKTLDQYTGRGGSALADGTRMTTVLQSWQPGDKGRTPPPGMTITADSSITVMARAKLSYSPPNLPLIWIKRSGFQFEHAVELVVSREEQRAAKAEQLERFLIAEYTDGRRYTKTQLKDSADKLSMTRVALLEALTDLEIAGLVVERALPKDERHGRRVAYLHPISIRPDSQ